MHNPYDPSGSLTSRPVDDGCHDVLFDGQRIGGVYRDPDAWSYAQWFIEGGPRHHARGGVNGKTLKRHSFRTLGMAVHECAVMASGRILQLLSGRGT